MRASLPFELTRFIGRERELTIARELLRTSRLITLIGVGGTGKTRLALELVSELETQFERGAAFVELVSVTDGSLIGETIVQALGLGGSGRRTPMEALIAALRGSECLLLLDNCEHLIGECAPLAETLLTKCPRLRILATSRQPTDVPGEVVFSVPSLSLPANDASFRDLIGSESVQLFADRAARARPGFRVDETNAQHVTRICQRLDGLPLAIELAAARVRSMSPDEILDRLDDGFSVLAQRSRTVEPRHQTLRATIDWSYHLLTADQRILFRRLSVFIGGWTIRDVEAVCADDVLLPRPNVVDLHSRLVDQSLILAEPGPTGPTRHRLLETIRTYAGERLIEAREAERFRARHFVHFLALAETYDEQRMAGGTDAPLPSLAAQRDNFRAALAWSIDADPEGSLRLTAALEDVWRMTSAGEGWRWLQRTLPAAPGDSPHRLRALLTAGMLSAYVPAYAEGAGLLRQVVSLARKLGDRSSEAWAELWLGRLALFSEDHAQAEHHLNAALAGHEALENELGQVRSLALLGLLEATVLDRRAESEIRLQRAVAIAERIADHWGQGYAHLMLGITAGDAADLERAETHCRAALAATSLGPILAVPLQGLARIVVERDPGRAMRLLGAAASHLERTGTLAPLFVRHRAQAAHKRAAELLDSRMASQLFEQGRKMTIDAAISYALSGGSAFCRAPGGLSPRELQVAALVARGETNRDIATKLFISVRTVESHLDHILTKLDLTNRTQLAAWAKDHDVTPVAGGLPSIP